MSLYLPFVFSIFNNQIFYKNVKSVCYHLRCYLYIELGPFIKKHLPNMSTKGKGNIDNLIKSLKQASFTKQLLLGSASGWLTGFMTIRVGKFASCAVGSGIILLEIAQHKGLVSINWDEVKVKATRKRIEMEEKYANTAPKTICNMRTFTRGNRAFTAGFIGGFLIGLSC